MLFLGVIVKKNKIRWYKKDDGQWNLNNLLALLNGDGGHYQDKYGTKKAIERGITRYYGANSGR